MEHSGTPVITVKERGKLGRPYRDGSRLLEHDEPEACKLGITSFLYCVFRALKLQWLQMQALRLIFKHNQHILLPTHTIIYIEVYNL